MTTTDLVVLDTIIAEAPRRITDEAGATIVPDPVATRHVSKTSTYDEINCLVTIFIREKCRKLKFFL